jgi:hypothetical protein
MLALLGAGRAPAGGGGFSPTDITGLKLWLKADSLVLSDGDPVGTWADSSGNGNDATASGGDKPTYKTAIVNGLPIVRFDAAFPNRMFFPTVTVSQFTIFVVYSVATFNTANYLVGGSGVGVFAGGGGGLGYGEYDGTFLRYATTQPTAIGLGTFSNQHIYHDSIEATYASAQDLTGFALTSVGIRADLTGAAAHTGDIAEILVYDSALGSTDRGNVEAYLAAKYGL